jgi:hypothetical protein
VAALLSPEDLENHRVAHELVRLKLRLPLVNHLTGIHIKPLRRQWNLIHPSSPPNGRLRESVRGFIADSLSAAQLASFVAVYSRLAPGAENQVDPGVLLRTLTLHQSLARRDLDINAAYFAVRDVRAKIVEWRRCGRCQTNFIYSPAAFHMRSCPFCALLRA